MEKPILLTPRDERLTLREKAELHHQIVILPMKNHLEEVLADFSIEDDGEIERGRMVMDFVISVVIILGMIYGEVWEWQKLLRKK